MVLRSPSRPVPADDEMARPAKAVVRPAALVEEVYEALLDRLMGLKLPPGSKITVDNLARELGVSQTPIREALTRLESEGLVLKTHLVGYSAAPQLSAADTEQLFELRLLLEPAAAAKAATRMTEDRFRTLRALQHDMAGLRDVQFPAYGQFARKDAEFHALIAGAGDNALLVDALARLHSHVHIFRLVFHARVTSEAIEEHSEILQALARQDAGASERAMRAHILASQNRIATLVEASA
jgi:DNA-binding GntR family transcriptional regulator